MKQKLRIENLLKRKNQHPAQKLLNDQKIIKKIQNHKNFKIAEKILFYLPIHGEVDLTALFNKYCSEKTFILPRVKGKTLHLHAIKSLRHTTKGKFSISEPQKHLPIINPRDLDAVLIPGVVFSEDGHRIGYGKGFYDRLLKKTNCPKIGIAYEIQIVKNIPGEKHDVPMDMIITEKRIIKENGLKVERKKPNVTKRV